MAAGAAALVPGGRLVVVGGARGSMAVGKGLALPLGWQVSAPFWGTRADLVAVVELARSRECSRRSSRSSRSATCPRPTRACTTAG